MEHKKNNFKQVLYKWAEDTAEFYHDKAISDPIYDLAFYTQSDLNKVSEKPELLILGINPGSGGKYTTNQIESDIWKDWGINGRMDKVTLLRGNPCLSKKDKWRTWQGLKRVFLFGGITDILNDESKYAWSNIIFFNEPKEKNIERELYQICPAKTLELIKILKPKRILCLSIRKCFDVLNKDIKEREVLIDSFLERGKLLDIPIYGIRHTSYANVGERVVGKCLKYLFENKLQGVSKGEITTKFVADIAKMNEGGNIHFKVNIEEINDRLEGHGFKFSHYNEKMGIYKAVYKGIGEDVLDFRLDIKSPKKYIAFRSTKRDFFNLEGKNLYKLSFSERFDIETNNWLIFKELRYYRANYSIEEQISNDIIALLDRIASHKI